ncbi:MAG: outer membrane beta-barrel protein [Rickettsiales bacterium]|jgi:opacity protein-like surface antigen|nr:outer membrane beta-barrel protein [Rickettsiales bacterium]
MKKLILAVLPTFALTPAFSTEYQNNSRIEPYIAMRASYITLHMGGNQDVYAAPGGVTGSKLASEQFDIDDSEGFGAKFAFGGDANLYALFGRLRLEIEYADNGNYVPLVSSAGGDVTFSIQNTTMFGNAYYSMNTGTRLSPYIGAGIGVSNFSSNVNFESGSFHSQMSKSEYKLGWQAGAGISMYLAHGAFIDLGYRFSDLGKFAANLGVSQYSASGGTILNSVVMRNHVDMNFTAHEIMLGIRYKL